MSEGIQITKSANIPDAKGTDFTVNSLFSGSFKLYKSMLFNFGGELTTMSATFGLSAYIQREKHGLNFVPAYLAYVVYGNIDYPDLVQLPYNDYISQGGESHFVNVTADTVIVGFDSGGTHPNFIKVLIFNEKLADA